MITQYSNSNFTFLKANYIFINYNYTDLTFKLKIYAINTCTLNKLNKQSIKINIILFCIIAQEHGRPEIGKKSCNH